MQHISDDMLTTSKICVAVTKCERALSVNKALLTRANKRYVYTDLKPHVCGGCGAAFPETQTFNLHVVKCIGGMPGVCNICCLVFNTNDKRSLANHMKMHKTHDFYVCGMYSQYLVA